MKRSMLLHGLALGLYFFCELPFCFSQGTNWHHITPLPVSNSAFSFTEMGGNLYVIGGENFEPN